jgi:hypothetical protein
MTILFANNASSTLAGPISSSAVTANLATGTGALFPAPTGGDYFVMTFVAASNPLVFEVVHCTARVGDTVTIVRGQEDTSAADWATNDIAAMLITAGCLEAFQQSVGSLASTYGTDSGSANAMVVTLGYAPPTLAGFTGIPLTIRKANTTSTGAVTLVVNGFAPTAVINGNITGLVASQLPANTVFTVVFDGFNFILQSSIYPQPLFAVAHDETGSRALNTLYTNTTGLPMFISAVAVSTGANGNLVLTIAGIASSAFGQPNTGGVADVSGMVPAGATYEITTTVAGFNLSNWTETF